MKASEKWGWGLAGLGACLVIFMAMRKVPGIGGNADAGSINISLSEPVIPEFAIYMNPRQFPMGQDYGSLQFNFDTPSGITGFGGTSFQLGDMNLHAPFALNYTGGAVALNMGDMVYAPGDYISMVFPSGNACGCGCDDRMNEAASQIGFWLNSLMGRG